VWLTGAQFAAPAVRKPVSVPQGVGTAPQPIGSIP
jgi:hypothetical protein